MNQTIIPTDEHHETIEDDGATYFNISMYGGVAYTQINAAKLAHQLQSLGHRTLYRKLSTGRYVIYSNVDLTSGF